jgi:hypothetical protein
MVTEVDKQKVCSGAQQRACKALPFYLNLRTALAHLLVLTGCETKEKARR